MRRRLLSLIVIPLVVLGVPCAAFAQATTPSTLATITVPDGFEVELVAGPPLVEHPTMAGFDERGRLFVADNAGVNFAAEELLEKLPNCVRMLEDTNGDGRFDRSTVFADKMTFPMGALAHRGSLYVASPPFIWKLTDTDGDGVADQREQIVGRFGFIGNAADIHGCFLGPEGRIYWCDGRHGHNFVDADGKQLSKGLAARIFSCRPDGSDVEVFCGGGMDNPVEVAFTDEGDMIGTMTFYNPDDARHDALMHFVYGGVYPRKHPCTAEFKRTGELMPALSQFDTVAPSGLTRYRARAWGDEYRDNFFSVHFNTHKVLRHALSRSGGTFRSHDADFLVSTNPDFHPTDVLEDADGSLLVVDTGGWFRIGCPTSQVAKPEIGGAIYRIRRSGARRPQDPRGLAMAWDDATVETLAGRLGDVRAAVRERAIEALADRGEGAIEPLASILNDTARADATRQGAIWSLVRIASPSARSALRGALLDPSAGVRQAAAYSLGSLRDTVAATTLAEIVVHDEPQVRREAAAALGRMRESAAVPALLQALHSVDDRFVEHALIYALIQINAPTATQLGLTDASPDVRRAALVALDQMDAGALAREQVTALLDTSDAPLLQAAMDVISRRPGWAAEIVDTLSAWLAEVELSPERAAALRGALVAFAGQAKVQELLAESLSSATTTHAARLLLLEVIARSDLKELPPSWSTAVRGQLNSADTEELRQAVIAAGRKGVTDCDARLLEIAGNTSLGVELRVAAAAAAARHATALDDGAFTLLRDQCVAEAPALRRLSAAAALGAAKLSDTQRLALAPAVEHAGPLELTSLLPALRDATDREIGLRWVSALEKSPGVASLSLTELNNVLASQPDEVRTAAAPMIARLNDAVREQAATLQAALSQLDGGDPAAGRVLFFGRKATCSACHRVGVDGGKIGPDLTKIGAIRTDRDLAESILMPSASLARGYESMAVTTQGGQIHTGLISRETASAIYVVSAQREEIRIDRAEIDQIEPSRQSLMPQGMERVLSPAELRDVVAYLRSLK